MLAAVVQFCFFLDFKSFYEPKFAGVDSQIVVDFGCVFDFLGGTGFIVQLHPEIEGADAPPTLPDGGGAENKNGGCTSPRTP